MTPKFERDKVYKTRDGREARVICVDAPGRRPIVSLHSTFNGPDEVDALRLYADGRYNPDGSSFTGSDLILPKPEPVVEWGYLDTYRHFIHCLTEQSAREMALTGYRLAKRTTEIVE